jgi:hypothetical protein
VTSTKAAILLGICIALYLAFAAEVHFLRSPYAAAALVSDSSKASPSAATASTSPFPVDELPPSDSLGQVSQQTDNSRECRLNANIDSNCKFE